MVCLGRDKLWGVHFVEPRIKVVACQLVADSAYLQQGDGEWGCV